MQIQKANFNDYAIIMDIWEESVRHTHDFLSDKDFKIIKGLIPTEFLPQLNVYIVEDNGRNPAFFSVSEDNLEMLFVRPENRRSGYGKLLIAYITKQLGIKKVDVNEQNEQAIGFYLKMGYVPVGRSEKDGMGKNYPLIHMALSTE